MCNAPRHSELDDDRMFDLFTKPPVKHIEYWPGICSYLCRNDEKAFVVHESPMHRVMYLTAKTPVPVDNSADLNEEEKRRLRMRDLGGQLASLVVISRLEHIERKTGLRFDISVTDFDRFLSSKKRFTTLDEAKKERFPDDETAEIRDYLEAEWAKDGAPPAIAICTNSGLYFGSVLYKRVLAGMEVGVDESIVADLQSAFKPLVYKVHDKHKQVLSKALNRMLKEGGVQMNDKLERLFAAQQEHEQLFWTEKEQQRKLESKAASCRYDDGGAETDYRKGIEYGKWNDEKVVEWKMCCSAEEMEELRKYESVWRAWDFQKKRNKMWAGNDYYYMDSLARAHNVLDGKLGIRKSPISIENLCRMSPAAEFVLVVLCQLANDWPESVRDSILKGVVTPEHDAEALKRLMFQLLGYDVGGMMKDHHDMLGCFDGVMVIWNIHKGTLHFGARKGSRLFADGWEVVLESLDALTIDHGGPSDVIYKHSIKKMKWIRISGVLRMVIQGIQNKKRRK